MHQRAGDGMMTRATGGVSNRQHLRERRRGSAYVWVLATSMLLAVVGFGAVTVQRIRVRQLNMSLDSEEAGSLATSAVEHALAVINNTPEWRTRYTSGVPISPVTLGRGTFQWKIVDEGDGDLADSPQDSARLYGIGRAGRACRMFSVLLAPNAEPLSCLDGALTVGGALTLSGVTVNPAGQKVACNANVFASTATVNADVEAVGTITGATYNGSNTSGSAPRVLPSGDVFEHYVTNGTAISISSIPLSGLNRQIKQQLLSPACNPFGGVTNPQGIYVINCMGESIQIISARIVGTLVLINPGGLSVIQTAVNWVPAVTNYPCLLVQGNISMKYGNTPFTESLNLNPPGTPYPYPSGASDSAIDDTYPSIIDGLIYVSGNLDSNQCMECKCLVGGGTYLAQSAMILNYDSRYHKDPPPGFRGGAVAAMPSSWRWEVVP